MPFMSPGRPSPLPWSELARPLARAEDALARLDERLRTSPIRDGWISRTHFADAAAALWIEGQLVHIEDLVLHDAGKDVRTPTHELTRAHAVLRARRRIAAGAPGWAQAQDAERARDAAAAPSSPSDCNEVQPAALPLTMERPNLVPSPVSASAVAESVRLSLTGSTFSAMEVSVSNRVLNSVVTVEASMTSALLIRAGLGFFGVDSATYLLPNTVLALMSACTLDGMAGM